MDSRWKWNSSISYFWLSLQTLVASILLNTLATVALSCANTLHFYSLMKPFQFEIEGPKQQSVALQEALQIEDKNCLMKYLAFQDFADLTLNCYHRRQELLTLSLPGKFCHELAFIIW